MNDVLLFDDKNSYLSGMYKEVNFIEFYRDIFPEGSFERKGMYEDRKGNGIAIALRDGKYIRSTITDELLQLENLVDQEFAIMNGISYFGNQRTMYNANFLYALIFDIDGLSSMDKLKNLLSHVSGTINPIPTYLVNSGHGVHLYYVFKDPIPLYNHLKQPLKDLKYYLTSRLWNMYVSDIDEIQYQGLNQAFRMVGSPSKFGKNKPLKAFKTGPKIDLDYLNSFIPDESIRVTTVNYKAEMSLKEAKDKYPVWYENKIVNKNKNTTWVVKRDLYDWWLKKIQSEATYGHRYFCIMSLAIYAAKCNVPYDELEKDAMDLIPRLNELNVNEKFTELDVYSALNSYSEEFKTFPRKDIEKITAISIPKNKRNGLTQKNHLEIARAIRDVKMKQQGKSWFNDKGRPTKEILIRQFIEKNPDKTPTEISKYLGVSRTTVYKYLNSTKN